MHFKYLVIVSAVLIGVGEFASQVSSENVTAVERKGKPKQDSSKSKTIGKKKYHLEKVFKGNFFKAFEFCLINKMNLVTIKSQEENNQLEEILKKSGLEQLELSVWTSGTDLAEIGSYVWLTSGDPIDFTNWNQGEPNHFRRSDGERDGCVELVMKKDGLKWYDSPCISHKTYFVCEYY